MGRCDIVSVSSFGNGSERMPDFLLREIDPDVLAVFRARAKAAGRSLQAEIQATLAESAGREQQRRAFLETAARFAGETRGRGIDDLAAGMRRDRDRDHRWRS